MRIDSLYQAPNIALSDTAYGVNDVSLPIRSVKTQYLVKKPIETLFEPNIRVVEVANWQIIILLGTFVLIGLVKAYSNNRFKQGIKALFNYGVAQEITREEKVFFHRSNILFTFIHLLTAALFIFQLKEVVNTKIHSLNSFWDFLLILAFLLGIYVVKYLFSKFLLFIFNDTTIAPEYIFNVSLYNNLLGVFLIIVLCLSYFSLLPFSFILIYISLPLILITFLLRVFRLFVIGEAKGVWYFYIFLYLCTLEFLPLVVLYRIFILK